MRVNLAARAASGEQRRARTRERLLDAAETVAAGKGLQAASIEEFVRAAGVSRGTFYNYFPTMTDLVTAMHQRVGDHLGDLLAHLASRPAEPAAQLASSLHVVLSAYLADPVRGWVALQLAGSGAPTLRSFESHFIGLHAEGVRLGRFRDVEVGAALALTIGAMRMIQRDVVTGAPPPQRAVQVITMILAGLGVPYDEAERISREEADAARRT